MKIDTEKIQKYLSDIKKGYDEIDTLLSNTADREILLQPWIVKGLKYTLIEIAESMANTLQHILAKDKGIPVTGYKETIIQAGERGIISDGLSNRLKPFFDFRNSLIHRYWYISEEKLLSLVRENKKDFLNFIDAIEQYIKNR